MMKVFAFPMALLLALSVPALAGQNGQGQNNNNQGQNGGNYRGAPGPLAGAGLPVLLIGAGVYLMVGRRKRHTAKPEA
jgi:hypothetical protein